MSHQCAFGIIVHHHLLYFLDLYTIHTGLAIPMPCSLMFFFPSPSPAASPPHSRALRLRIAPPSLPFQLPFTRAPSQNNLVARHV